MSPDIDNAQYMGLFLEETAEQLHVLEQETIKLEQKPSAERLQLLFRAAHTIKGASRAMGFMRLGELTHEMENLLDKLRNAELQVDAEIADALLACLDALTAMHRSISEGGGDEVDTAALTGRLRRLCGSSPAPAQSAGPAERFTPEQTAQINSAAQRARAPVYVASFELAEGCAMKLVRAFMAITAVGELGQILFTDPDPDELEAEPFDLAFRLIFQSDAREEAIRERLGQIGEVKSLSVERLAAEGDGAQTPATSGEPERAAGAQHEQRPTAGKPLDTGHTVRVDVARLDRLIDLVGELVIDRTRIAQIGASLAARSDYDTLIESLAEATGHISRITEELQEQIMNARMLPIETVFSRLPRVVRDLARSSGKDVRLETDGGETELDRSVIEAISDPILHILRNSVDHGIEAPEVRRQKRKPETGLIRVSARHDQNLIVLRIEDDGAGIDVEALKEKSVAKGVITREAAGRLNDQEARLLVFHSGVSTARRLTEVSGRGVGMDIVRGNLQDVGGMVEVESKRGEGTSFTLRLPLTLAIIRGLLVRIDGTVFVAPLANVDQTLRVTAADVRQVNQRPVIDLRGETLPVIRGSHLFWRAGLPKGGGLPDHFCVVVLGSAEQRLGLIVDQLLGDQEVVIKSLDQYFGEVPGISGATILGDGSVALIMDIAGVAREALRA
jgi:two-component system chemotaxis sensor kinase CheA